MTLVIGLEDPKGVILGSDSYAGSEDFRDSTDAPKWFKLGPLWVAWAGSFAVAKAAEHMAPVPARKKGERDAAYLFRMTQALYTACLSLNSVKPDEGEYILVWKNRVYTVETGGAPVRSRHGYAAAGAGAFQAVAALAATEGLDGEERVRKTMEAVGRHCTRVASPYHILRAT